MTIYVDPDLSREDLFAILKELIDDPEIRSMLGIDAPVMVQVPDYIVAWANKKGAGEDCIPAPEVNM